MCYTLAMWTLECGIGLRLGWVNQDKWGHLHSE